MFHIHNASQWYCPLFIFLFHPFPLLPTSKYLKVTFNFQVFLIQAGNKLACSLLWSADCNKNNQFQDFISTDIYLFFWLNIYLEIKYMNYCKFKHLEIYLCEKVEIEDLFLIMNGLYFSRFTFNYSEDKLLLIWWISLYLYTFCKNPNNLY